MNFKAGKNKGMLIAGVFRLSNALVDLLHIETSAECIFINLRQYLYWHEFLLLPGDSNSISYAKDIHYSDVVGVLHVGHVPHPAMESASAMTGKSSFQELLFYDVGNGLFKLNFINLS